MLVHDHHAYIAAIGDSRAYLLRGDRFEQLTRKLTDAELHAILKGASLDAIYTTLIDTANARGGEDNITALVLEVTGADIPVATPGERIAVDTLNAFFD